MDIKPKAQATKAQINKWNYIKLKSFHTEKQIEQIVKVIFRMKENICKSYIRRESHLQNILKSSTTRYHNNHNLILK